MKKWRLWLIDYFIIVFYINIVFGLRTRGRIINRCSNPKIVENAVFNRYSKALCFVANNSLRPKNVCYTSICEKTEDDRPKLGHTQFTINSYGNTHYHNPSETVKAWSSYYNRNVVRPQMSNFSNAVNYPSMGAYNQPVNQYYPPPTPYQNIPQYRPQYQPQYQVGVINPPMNYYHPQPAQPAQSYMVPNQYHVQPSQLPNPGLSNNGMGNRGYVENIVTLYREIVNRKKMDKFSTFEAYKDVFWWNDDTDDWPGTNKINPGEIYFGLFHYWFTPFDGLVLLVDKRVEGSVNLADLPEPYSKVPISDTFKLGHLMRFKIKMPPEYDDKGRPRFVPCFDLKDFPKYNVDEKIRGTPVFFTSAMGVFQLEDGISYAQVFLVNTGLKVLSTIQYKMVDLFTKGELVELEVIRKPFEPVASGYLCRIPFGSEKGLELGSKYTMIYDPADYAPGPRQEPILDMGRNRFEQRDVRMENLRRDLDELKYRIKDGRTQPEEVKRPKKIFENEYERMIPFVTEQLSLYSFVKRIGADLKSVLRYILLKTGSIPDPSNPVSPTFAKALLNFVKEKRIFRVDGNDEHDELVEFGEMPVKIERNTVVGLLGCEGNKALFDALCGSKLDEREVIKFGSVSGKYPMTLLDAPKSSYLGHVRNQVVEAMDVGLIVIDPSNPMDENTVEAIEVCKKYKRPYIFVILEEQLGGETSLDDVMFELMDKGEVVEQLGGDKQMIVFSTKEIQENKDKLLETVHLEAMSVDQEESDDEKHEGASGYILDVGNDSTNGCYALVLVKRGKLSLDDWIVSDTSVFKVKTARNKHGPILSGSGSSQVGYLCGIEKNKLPKPGSKFQTFDNQKDVKNTVEINRETQEEEEQESEEAEEEVEFGLDLVQDTTPQEEQIKYIPVLLSSDVMSVAMAIKEELEKMEAQGERHTYKYQVVEIKLGKLLKGDLDKYKHAKVVVVYNSTFSHGMKKNLDELNIKLINENDVHKIVCKAENEIGTFVEGKKLGRLVGTAQILNVFNAAKKRKVAGCVVTFGSIRPSYNYRIMRGGKVLFYGKLASLRRTTEDATEILETESCGMVFENFDDFVIGDIIEAYEN